MASKTMLALLFLLSSSVCMCLGHGERYPVTVTVQGVTSIGSTDDQYICATLDWWPQNKCDYNMCPWDHSCTILSLELNNTILVNAIKAFGKMRIRIGGSLQDQVTYWVGKEKKCPRFRKKKNGVLFGFSRGCLPMKRWDQINHLFNKTGAQMTFGLNALSGRKKAPNDTVLWVGNWDPSNAIDLINYTISKGYNNIHSYELGNELAGSGVSARVDVEQYAKDIIKLRKIVNQMYPNPKWRPKVIGPAGFFQKKWFARFMEASGEDVVDCMTHHIYNMGSGGDPRLFHRIQDPYYLDNTAETFKDARDVINNNGPWSQAWVGESGGAYNSGGRLQTTFLSGFWYLDQLGMAATFNHKVYCRQSLVGGNYGLLNKKTFLPNPDYYSALLWHRIMGSKALAVSHSGPPTLRAYAHCLRNQEKDQNGIAILMINMERHLPIEVNVVNDFGFHPLNDNDDDDLRSLDRDCVFQQRLEYRLTPKDGDVKGNVMLLNGKALELTETEEIPRMEPDHVDPMSTIFLQPRSYTFAELRYFKAPACN